MNMMNRINAIKTILKNNGVNNYENYHIHSSLSNVMTPDCSVLKIDYAKRAIELGQNILSSCEHGISTLAIESYDIANEPKDHKLNKKLKFVFCVEAYYVDDRFSTDNRNFHIILMAKNMDGMKDINRIISMAHKKEAFYYKPRIDWELLNSINVNNVVVTTACLGGIAKERDTDMILKFRDLFPNFYLEVQAHRSNKQMEFNKYLAMFSKMHDIPLISACDSHFIFPEQSVDRDAYLLSKGIEYPEESGWDNDFPDLDTLIYRYVEQGVLSDEQIAESIINTNIVLDFEDIYFDKEIKVPTMFPELSMEEKNKKLRDIVYDNFNKYAESDEWVEENRSLYIVEIEKELDVIVGTDFADYFLLNYYIIKRGEELGGRLTATGRGSAPGFLLCKFLGFTTIDRMRENIPLISERFATKERILESRSLFDIDFNLSNQAPFVQASKEFLGGEEFCYNMCALGEYKEKSAFKMYARANNVDFTLANAVVKQIEQYEKDCEAWEEYEKIDDDDVCPINIYDYVTDENHVTILNESKKYIGIYDNIKGHACGFLLYNKNLMELFGLTVTRKGDLVLNITGKYADKYKYLKNDFLIVAVVDIIDKVFVEVGIPNWKEVYPTTEIKKIITNNPDIMKKVYWEENVVGVNQVEQKASSTKVKKFKPSSLEELTQFTAAVRPGFSSNFNRFVNRDKNEYGVEMFDKTLRGDYTDSSWVLFQEDAMKSMAIAGISMKDTYDVIKAISKKKESVIMSFKEQFISGFVDRLMKESDDPADF